MIERKMQSNCCDWTLRVQTNCQEVDRIILMLFGGFIDDRIKITHRKKHLNVTISKHNSGYIMSGNGKTYTIKDIQSVGFYLYAVIDKLIEANMKSNYSVFHGGVVALDGKAFGIIAPTKAGKSTLIAYLSQRGYTYCADDYIFVNNETDVVSKMPLPISLRDIDILGDAIKEECALSGYNELRGENNYYVMFPDSGNNNCQLEGFVFISRSGFNDFRIMSKGDAYKELLFNLKKAINLEKEHKSINNLVNHINSYKLSYKDFGFVDNCIKRL